MKPIASQTENSPQSIENKLKAKFGDKFKAKQSIEKEKKDEAKISTKAKNKHEFSFVGDIKDNAPDSEVTQEKLRALLKSGGFNFNEKERSVLFDILDI